MTTGNGGDGHGATREEERPLGRDARDLLAAVEELSTDLGATVREQIDRRPWVTLGIGFVGGSTGFGPVFVAISGLLVVVFLMAGLARPADFRGAAALRP